MCSRFAKFDLDMQGEPALQRGASRSLWRLLGIDRPTSAARVAQIAVLLGAPMLLIGVLAWPMLFTSGDFNEDWAHHLWFIWNQSFAIRDSYHPSFFLNTVDSVFYPQYAFYGGTLDAAVGMLSLALGNAPIEAYVLTYLLGFAAAYGGWYWMARAGGLRGWWAHVPSATFITSAYYLTLVYARGDLPEFIGVSMIPLMVASGLSVLRADRLRFWPALALACSSVMFFGKPQSHDRVGFDVDRADRCRCGSLHPAGAALGDAARRAAVGRVVDPGATGQRMVPAAGDSL